MAKVTNLKIGLQADNLTTAYATWEFSKHATEMDYYRVYWYYYTENNIWFNAGYNDVKIRQATYSIPSNATRIKVSIKPVSKKYKKNGKQKSHWTGTYVQKIYNLAYSKPAKPSPPNVTIDGLKLTATLDLENTTINDRVNFQVVKGNKKYYQSKNLIISETGNRVSFSTTVEPGGVYRVKCQVVNYKKVNSTTNKPCAWSDYSDFSNEVKPIPDVPQTPIRAKGSGVTSVTLSWKKATGADSYDIEYTDNKSYFNSNPSAVQSTTSDTTHAEITGLESGKKWFFRVRAKNEQGESAWRPKWDDITGVAIGSKPAPPTAWSFSNTASIGDTIPLYWVHNTEDGSNQYSAIIRINGKESVIRMGDAEPNTEGSSTDYKIALKTGKGSFDYVTGNGLIVDFNQRKTKTDKLNLHIPNSDDTIRSTVVTNATDYWWYSYSRVTFVYDSTTGQFTIVNVTEAPGDGDPDGTFVYYADTSGYTDSSQLKWQVRTRGIVWKSEGDVSEWSDYSAQRAITLYDSPAVSLTISAIDGEETETYGYEVQSLPLFISAITSPSTQKPLSYHVSIVANNTYPTEDDVGRETIITEGTEVFSKVVVTSTALSLILRPGDVHLENNESYTVNVKAAMNSGLTCEASDAFEVVWSDVDEHFVTASVDIDPETLEASISPKCYDSDDVLVGDVDLSVYRIEYDGTFTEIETGIRNNGRHIAIDPHPSLDRARYRIVATDLNTGIMSFEDIPGESVEEKAIVLNYNGQWTSYEEPDGEDELAIQPSSSVMIKLPYNIDVSERNDPDVSLIEYLGREHPVTYYGTQRGVSASWSTIIPKTDTDTLQALRLLAAWRGDVYVREPSGVGYWAHVKVTFDIKHDSLTIPISFDISRVEGGK